MCKYVIIHETLDVVRNVESLLLLDCPSEEGDAQRVQSDSGCSREL